MFALNTASKALRYLASRAQYSTKRNNGYSKAIGWNPCGTGAIITFADDTCETFDEERIASAAEDLAFVDPS